MARVSVILNTFNEEKNIERCLRSVAWADEIVVIDSFSTDRTRELAARFTDKIFTYEYPGNTGQSARGIAHATGDWIFIIDADEEVTPDLAASIRKTANDPAAFDGYRVNREVFAFGAWIRYGGWSPDWQFRLFRKGKEKVDHREVHGGFTVDGEEGQLDGALNHYTYDTIEQYLDKMNDYTSLQVSNRLQDDPDYRVHWYKLVFSPLSHFWQVYVVRKGYRDGIHGLYLAALDAIYSLSLYSKIWEYRYRKETGGPLPPITNREIRALKQVYR